MDLTAVTALLASELRHLAHRFDRAGAETDRVHAVVARAAVLDWRSPAGSACIGAMALEVHALGLLAQRHADTARALRLVADRLETTDLAHGLPADGIDRLVLNTALQTARRALQHAPLVR